MVTQTASFNVVVVVVDALNSGNADEYELHDCTGMLEKYSEWKVNKKSNTETVNGKEMGLHRLHIGM